MFERFAVIVNLHLNKTLKSLKNDFIKFTEEEESVAEPTDTTHWGPGIGLAFLWESPAIWGGGPTGFQMHLPCPTVPRVWR